MSRKHQLAENYKALEEDILHLDSLFEREGRVLYDERNKLKVLKIRGEEVAVKRYKKPHLINQFAYRYVRKSKAERAFLNASKLLEKGIKTPPPVGFLELHSPIGLQYSYYVCLFQPHTCTIRKVMDDYDFPNRESLLRAFAQFTIELQNKGIYFLDHSPGNTLLLEDAHSAAQFSLVDINRMQFQTLTNNQRFANFSKLSTDSAVLKLFAEESAKALKMDVETVFSVINKRMEADQAKRRFKRRVKFWK